jgi:hypothetical protein
MSRETLEDEVRIYNRCYYYIHREAFEEIEMKNDNAMLVESGDGEQTYTCNFYTCPKCGDKHIMGVCNYCSNCGIKLRWPVDLNEIKGE